MTYLKIGEVDFSAYVNELKVTSTHHYNSQTNAAGDTVVDYINKKRIIDVGIVTVDDSTMADLMTAIESFNVKISYRDPRTNSLETEVNCIIPTNEVSYYTIQTDKVLYNTVLLKFYEL